MPDHDWIVAVDTGGTFTDAVAVRSDGAIRVAKTPSTPDDPGAAFETALRELVGADVSPTAVRLLLHGTTVATNALLTGQLARVALATTEGFRDVLGYRGGSRPVVYDLAQSRPRELVARRDRIEVAERLSGEGKTLVPLTAAEIDRVAGLIAAREPEAVAVAFLFSYLDDSHEQTLRDELTRRLPGVPVTTSAEIAREYREYPRAATAALNAGLRPVVGTYLLGMRARLERLGIAAPLLIMQSSGGCLPAVRAEREAHRLVLSGPTAGVAGSAALGARYGLRRLVTLDLGGTSLDVCLIPDGVPPVVPAQVVADNPILCPSVDMVTIGAGGGSIVWTDRAGRLRIGPGSAGARPGPAAYGHGGTEATLTDAHVVAGTLPTGLRLAGGLELHVAAARKVVEAVGRELGLDAGDAADGIIRVAVAQMAGVLRQISVQRGIDPREYTLLAFGGAGPLHAGLLLRELGFRSVLVPQHPGLFAAAGLISADLRIDESLTVLRLLEPGLHEELAAWYAGTSAELAARLERDGLDSGDVRFIASADCRFAGQGYELRVPVALSGTVGLEELHDRFCDLHQRTYGHADRAQRVEIVTVRLTAFGVLPGAEPEPLPAGNAQPPAAATVGRVSARLPGSAAAVPVPVYDRARLLAGNLITGPAIVHQLDATTVVLGGQRARIDELAGMWIEETS